MSNDNNELERIRFENEELWLRIQGLRELLERKDKEIAQLMWYLSWR